MTTHSSDEGRGLDPANLPLQLLATAKQQAERSDPAVRAAALLHIARVLTVFDRAEAVRLLEDGLTQASALSGLEKEAVLGEGLLLAASVAPGRALTLLASGSFCMPPKQATMHVIHVMLDHGYWQQAAAYLSAPGKASEYPFSSVPNVMLRCADETTRLEILRGAIKAWAESPSHEFARVFSQDWRMLPQEEAALLARKIVEFILSAPDEPVRARIAPEWNGVEFTSMQDYRLFEILNVLRRLEPGLTDSLIQAREQFAAGAARFPYGMDSAKEESVQHAAAPIGPGFVMAGSAADFPLMLASVHAQRGGSIEPVFDEALRFYEKDSASANPNRAPRECWPSTQAFREALYLAAKSHGRDATAYLERIPDPDLRLFATIELVAALVGLPQLRGSRRTSRHS